LRLGKRFGRLRKLQVTQHDIQGYCFIRQAKLDHAERMAVIMQTQGGLTFNDVRNALKGSPGRPQRRARGEGPPGGPRPRGAKAYLASVAPTTPQQRLGPGDDSGNDPIVAAMMGVESSAT
jgi:hypothetical protein